MSAPSNRHRRLSGRGRKRPRDYSTPSRALLGRWVMVDGSGEVSFTADGNYHFVDPAGSPGRAEYVVLEEDGERRTIATLVRLKEFKGEPVEE